MNLDLRRDFEARMLGFAREVLSSQGVRELSAADLRIIWSTTSHGRLPLLILAFDLPEFAGQLGIPSLAIALCRVRKGTLLDLEAAGTFYEPGDALRDHILRSTDHYLTSHGVRLSVYDAEEIDALAKPSLTPVRG